ncbi:UDP-N-acetylmuramoyl-tripeptide--D-alanyl-D-alanine ligase [Thalassococcus sp. S3]|uniref:UDP-N-acetylmuramoyl-tripeptide--D-alanyl-D- alanine ligase n=1 Tax=Thalassococcus sp. S3 TaxID=2017482 RepID=UPI00102400FB|nr:UDP-N-acetylmuramoyl-tripeptide--D-alanyl-D-alanine ligase [Thalassococcus sp. S3]QBF31243.1 UDP-N-acetylmuramoyl-tripeptide--D-alanyl-D-alanine ligase [Thalassococcus sp. S3]
MILWTAKDAAAATGGTATGDWQASGVSIDTRTLVDGDLFVALKDVRDGHDFVAQALSKGASAAMVSRVPDGVAQDAPLLIVDDVQAGLEALGRAARARTKARVVAITGSVGKTSTKEMLARMLGAQGQTHASVASYNNHWGVPLTLARMPADTEYAVIEIGMNHPGEIAPLSRMAKPHVALITTVGAAHLEAFDNIEGIAVEKASIIEGLEPGGTAILNNDIEQAAILQSKAADQKVRDIGFGRHGFDFVLKDVQVQDECTVVQATAHEAPLLFKLATPGVHFAMNGLGALAACEALGADLALATHALGRWTPYRGRGARETLYLDPVETDLTLELIDDAYNANPTSMSAALSVLAAASPRHDIGRVSKGRRIAVLGDMKELGANEAALHAALADHEAIPSLDVIHCVGPLMQSLHQRLGEDRRGLWAETSAEMAQVIRSRLDSGDVVLVKGSLSMDLARIVDAIRKMGHPPPQDNE